MPPEPPAAKWLARRAAMIKMRPPLKIIRWALRFLYPARAACGEGLAPEGAGNVREAAEPRCGFNESRRRTIVALRARLTKFVLIPTPKI